MKTEKTFDCVKMKNEIQDALYRERKGMSGAQVRRAIQRNLATSSAPVARLWRRLNKEQASQTRRRSSSLSHRP